MIQNNNLSVLPFYTNIEEQNHRKPYAFGAIYPLFTPINLFPPFQIMRPTSTANAWNVKLYTKDDVLVKDITQAMIDTGAKVLPFTDKGIDVIIYPGQFPLSINQQEGQYYLKITDGETIWYSDIFTSVNGMEGYLKLEWYNENNIECDAGVIVFHNPRFINRLYICSELGKPEYEFEEDGVKRDGYFFAEKQISKKTYKFTMTASEYLCDVMRLVRMMDYVRITDQYGRYYDTDTFLITPRWQTQGDIASLECEFTTETVVKKNGTGYSIQVNKGDFNYDFNKDYLI